jgi:hypothetical protein
MSHANIANSPKAPNARELRCFQSARRHVEQDATPLSKHHTFLLFRIEGEPGRFWSDAVGSGNVAQVFPHPGAAVKVYKSPASRHRDINGDGRKTFGLRVDGEEIVSVDDALSRDRINAQYVIPVLGLIALLFAVRRWKKESRETT